MMVGFRDLFSPKGFVLIFGLMTAIGIIVLVVGAILYMDEQEMQNWPETVGTIYSADIRSEIHSQEHGGFYYLFFTDMQYNYIVSGQTYHGNVFSRIHSSSTAISYTPDFVSPYSVGTQVTVYYDPANPSDAVLQKDSTTEILAPIIIGAGWTTIGAVGVFYFYRKLKKG